MRCDSFPECHRALSCAVTAHVVSCGRNAGARRRVHRAASDVRTRAARRCRRVGRRGLRVPAPRAARAGPPLEPEAQRDPHRAWDSRRGTRWPTPSSCARSPRRFGLPFHLHQADVPAIDGNLEQAAREVRQSFLPGTDRDPARSTASPLATRDPIRPRPSLSDPARLGPDRALRNPAHDRRRHRPPAAGNPTAPKSKPGSASTTSHWREDATNQDRTYARNRLRHEILPLLRDAFNPQLDEALANLATLAQDEEAYWAVRSGPPPATSHQPPATRPTRRDFADAPPALARRLIRRAFEIGQRRSPPNRLRPRGTRPRHGAVDATGTTGSAARPGRLPLVRLDPHRASRARLGPRARLLLPHRRPWIRGTSPLQFPYYLAGAGENSRLRGPVLQWWMNWTGSVSSDADGAAQPGAA